MSDKKAVKEPLDTEKAKDLELDETPKPTRKVGKSSVPLAVAVSVSLLSLSRAAASSISKKLDTWHLLHYEY
jgi:hypothetical protein